MDPRRFLRDDIDDLAHYAPVQPLEVLAEKIGVPVDQLVKLDANENLYGAPAAVREAAAAAPLHIYPDPDQTALRADIAAYLDVRPEHVVAGAGSDDLLDVVLRLTLPPATATATPSFGMYSFLSGIAGMRHIEVPRRAGFMLDLAGLRAAVADGAGVVFIASPTTPPATLPPSRKSRRSAHSTPSSSSTRPTPSSPARAPSPSSTSTPTSS